MSFADHRSKHPPPPWMWGRRSPVLWQMTLALVLAVAVIFAAKTLLPASFAFAQRILYVTAHEGSHALASLLQGGDVSGFVIRPDGSGEVTATNHDAVFSALAGPVGPAWLAAVALMLGLVRVENTTLLLSTGTVLYVVAHCFGTDTRVFWALLSWAAVTGLIGFAPIGPLVKSVTVLIFGLTLGLAVLDALPYLWVEEVKTEATPLAQTLPTGDSEAETATTTPSDVRLVADVMGARDITEARRILITLMAAGAALSTIGVTNFVLRHRL
ncbi:M50 family metallopeptidase [Rhodobacter capsulatus]|uniref:M50 family metallopeptidase n=1 Tax=Rhodobacter capsulatus TaxID=1061 RepID=UPI0003D2F0D5|nr:M50 family metallopeptidase [Rhodobacter capsulatus]ETD83420.1 hypothetical protein U716_09175 [Rhodobacter capsulatus B6]